MKGTNFRSTIPDKPQAGQSWQVTMALECTRLGLGKAISWLVKLELFMI